jgi:protein phosphatase
VADESEVSELVVEELDEDASAPQALVEVRAAGRTERGRRRDSNEDALIVFPRVELFAVADGVAGVEGGELASELALETLRHALLEGALDGVTDMMRPRRADALARAVESANRAVHERALCDASYRGMATTLTALRTSARRGRAYVAHVGDSRCYRLRDGELELLTRDHTRGAELDDVGPLSRQLSRAVGIEPTIEVDVLVTDALPGDRFLLCTDGLSRHVDDATLAALASGDDLEACVAALCDHADEVSGKDNITAVVVALERASQPCAVSTKGGPSSER